MTRPDAELQKEEMRPVIIGCFKTLSAYIPGYYVVTGPLPDLDPKVLQRIGTTLLEIAERLDCTGG